jgi:hypothetical protein
MANEYCYPAPFDTRPQSLIQCEEANSSEADFLRLAYYNRQADKRKFFVSSLLFDDDTSEIHDDKKDEGARNPRRKRRLKKNLFFTIDNGVRILTSPIQTNWYRLYIVSPNLDNPKFKQKFRRRFRLPYDRYLELLDIVKKAERDDGELYFRRWMSYDATGVASSPIEIMLLGALRYLGRGLTFDDIEEATCISEETHRQFFEVFTSFGREVLYPKWVIAPKDKFDAETHLHEMQQAGFHGCIGSCDATHVLHERISHAQQQSHSSFKVQGTARTYNITVNHRRYIMSSTTGHPCRWNDKTLQLFDTFLNNIYKGKILQDVIFELLQKNEHGEIISVKYRGVWIMVDNGYLNRSITIPPMKSSLNIREIKWSQWLESMRKDVECTFGILKGRWRILKAGIRVHGVRKADNIWHTCCALHNWLLEIDGLNEPWTSGELVSDWENELGQFEDSHFVEKWCCSEALGAISRLRKQDDFRTYDSTQFGSNRQEIDELSELNPDDTMDDICESNANVSTENEQILLVKNLSQAYFRSRLVEHFDILYQRGEIIWPKRNSSMEPIYP